MRKIYRVRLSGEEREGLKEIVRKGKANRTRLVHARILLKADEAAEGGGWKDADIAEALEVGHRTVERVRQRCVEEGLKKALERRPSSRQYERKVDGAVEARLIALACGPAPEGRTRWTVSLLADRLVELRIVESLGRSAVHRTLKKMNLSLG